MGRGMILCSRITSLLPCLGNESVALFGKD